MLETLPPQEQTDTVRDVCPRCTRWVEAVRRGIVAQIPGLIRDQIAARACEPPAMRWWQRFVKTNVGVQRRPAPMQRDPQDGHGPFAGTNSSASGTEAKGQ